MAMTDDRRRALFHGAVLGGLLFFAYLFLIVAPRVGSFGYDAVAYWRQDLTNLYSGSVGDLGFFPYSPAAVLPTLLLGQLPWPVYIVLWVSLLLATLAWLGRRSFLVLLAFPPVAVELYHGNIHILLAAAMVFGFRYPAAWSFVLLTKVTPGIGLLWFAFRREWRRLSIALGTTMAVSLVSLLLLPALWADWLTLLSQSAGQQVGWPALPVPLWLRMPVAAVVVWWGARRDAFWTVPLAGTIALPVLWVAGLSVLVGCWALREKNRRYYVPDAPQPGRSRSSETEADDRPAGLQRGTADRVGAG